MIGVEKETAANMIDRYEKLIRGRRVCEIRTRKNPVQVENVLPAGLNTQLGRDDGHNPRRGFQAKARVQCK